MPWLFLVPLTAGAVCTYISQKSSDDITYLTATIAVVCLFLSLVLAPWQIQVGILVLTVLFVGKALQSRVSEKTTETLPESKHIYRGVTYSEEETAMAEAIHEDVAGKYRGVPVNITATKTVQIPSAKPRKYRGVIIEPDDA